MKLKPCYVVQVKPGDYSQCTKCYNFEQVKKDLIKRLSVKSSNISDVLCDNYDFDDSEYVRL